MTRPRLAQWPVAAVLSLLALGSLLAAAARHRLRRIEVAGTSMLPGLAPGEFIVVRRGALSVEGAAGAIVAFHAPQSPGAPQRPEVLLKRIVGLPGEMLRVGAAVEVNGRVLREPYRQGVAAESSYRGVHAVPPGSYFVLGDSREESTDSREFGAIEADRILGEAIWRYWPPRRFGPIRRAMRVWAPSDGD
jgi:signal peptidase I